MIDRRAFLRTAALAPIAAPALAAISLEAARAGYRPQAYLQGTAGEFWPRWRTSGQRLIAGEQVMSNGMRTVEVKVGSGIRGGGGGGITVPQGATEIRIECAAPYREAGETALPDDVEIV